MKSGFDRSNAVIYHFSLASCQFVPDERPHVLKGNEKLTPAIRER